VAGSAVYRPFALGEARVHVALPDGSPYARTVLVEAPLEAAASGPDWSAARECDAAPAGSSEPPATASFAGLPAAAGKAGAAAAWGKSLAEAIYRGTGVTVFESKRLRVVSKPGESERDFRVRIAEAARADRDAQVDRLREKYAPRLAALLDRIRRAETALAREKDQADSQRVQTAVSLGATLLTAFLGRKRVSQSTLGRAATTARGVDRAARQQRDVAHAQDNVEALRRQRDELAQELETEIREIELRSGADQEVLATRTLRPRKSDIEVLRVAVLWRPAA
jgi:hypothetical protein